MQSVSRVLRRENAVMIFDNVSKRTETVFKKGSESKFWSWAVRNKLEYSMQNYCENVSKPLVREGEKIIKRRRKR